MIDSIEALPYSTESLQSEFVETSQSAKYGNFRSRLRPRVVYWRVWYAISIYIDRKSVKNDCAA